LVFDPTIHGTDTRFNQLMNELQLASIVFFDPLAAASHINQYVQSPAEWWDSHETMGARVKFAAALNCTAGDGVKGWIKLLRSELSKPNQKVDAS